MTITIGREEYRDKVAACWMGKNIGGTLGERWECTKFVNSLQFYEPVPEKASPNDDLDLQLVWLQCMEEQGTDPSVCHLADYWVRYANSYPWNEYGFFMRNTTRGLRPPVAGCFENYYVDEMGSPIRSEIWACLYPGDPQSAARMAWKDSALDHAGGEGMWGEMFWSAVESAAFVEDDPLTLIGIGLGMIPLASHVARAIREAMWCHASGLNWGEARERIALRFGHYQPCNAVPNHAFTIIGWLYGEDFGDCMCKAVNCGYDTDCTGATLGSLLGILGGMEFIPQKWIDPIGDEIVVHKYTRGLNAPATLSELTDRTIVLAEQTVAANVGVEFGEQTVLPGDLLTLLHRNALALEARAQDVHMGVELLGDTEVCFHYGGEPVLRPGVGREVSVSVPGQGDVEVELTVPAGWTCARRGPARFLIASDGPVADRNTVTVKLAEGTVDFVVLGPGEAKGFPAGENVEICPTCWARVEACICP